MYQPQIATFSDTDVSCDRAVQNTTAKANAFLSETEIAEILHYSIQTIHEPSVVCDNDLKDEYYTHVISIVFRRP